MAFRRLLAVFIAALAILPIPAHAEWRRATSKHFVIYSEGRERSLLDFATRLERFDALLEYATKLKERDEDAPKLTIFALSSQASVRRAKGEDGKNVAGFYSPRPGGAIAVIPRGAGGSSDFDLDAETILFHEYAHHFMMQYFPSAYPAWYTEGFAEFYSTAEAGADGKFSIGKPAKHRFYGLVMTAPMPVQMMFNAHKLKMNGEQGDNFYGRSWLLTHYLSFDKARSGQLGRYISAINTGTDPDKAAADAFGAFEDLDRDLKRYQNARRLTYLQVNGVRTEIPQINIELLSGAEDALVPTRLDFMQGISDEDRERYAKDVARATARFPNDPASVDALAGVAMLNQDLDRAHALNETYLQIRPEDSRALLRRAEIAAARLEVEGAKPGPADWKAVRALIGKANRANVHDPLPLAAYYRSFEREGRPPTSLATDGLDRALVLTPQDSGLRLTLAAQFVNDGKIDLARRVLRPLAYSPHDEGAREHAREMLASIDEDAKDEKNVESEPAGE